MHRYKLFFVQRLKALIAFFIHKKGCPVSGFGFLNKDPLQGGFDPFSTIRNFIHRSCADFPGNNPQPVLFIPLDIRGHTVNCFRIPSQHLCHVSTQILNGGILSDFRFFRHFSLSFILLNIKRIIDIPQIIAQRVRISQQCFPAFRCIVYFFRMFRKVAFLENNNRIRRNPEAILWFRNIISLLLPDQRTICGIHNPIGCFFAL